MKRTLIALAVVGVASYPAVSSAGYSKVGLRFADESSMEDDELAPEPQTLPCKCKAPPAQDILSRKIAKLPSLERRVIERMIDRELIRGLLEE